MKPATKRILLITGASGFVGRHCLPLLAQEFDELHASFLRKPIVAPAQVRWHQADLCHAPSAVGLVSTIRPTHLLHLAWVTEHGQFWNSLQNPRWLEASMQLLRAFALWGGKRVVTAGTCGEYDWTGGHCHESLTACNPHSLYGACKHALRLAAKSISGLSHAHGRLFHLYGPHEDTRRLTPSVIQALATGKRAACTKGEQVRDLMYIEDAAAALTRLLLSDVQGSVNIASGTPITIKDFVLSIGRQMGCSSAIDFGALATRPEDPPRLTADVSRLRQELNFSNHHTLYHGIARTLNWHQATRKTLCPQLPTAVYAAATQLANF